MTVQECYEKINGNYKGVIARLMTEERVKKFAMMFLKDTSCEKLRESLAAEDYGEAFRAAHTLKGICQNLDFTGLQEPANELTELLRDLEGTQPSEESKAQVQALMDEVQERYQITVSAIQEL